eukprot:SAG22_NODE_439_length_10489_cov_7.745813_4_plen_1335_part_00
MRPSSPGRPMGRGGPPGGGRGGPPGGKGGFGGKGNQGGMRPQSPGRPMGGQQMGRGGPPMGRGGPPRSMSPGRQQMGGKGMGGRPITPGRAQAMGRGGPPGGGRGGPPGGGGGMNPARAITPTRSGPGMGRGGPPGAGRGGPPGGGRGMPMQSQMRGMPMQAPNGAAMAAGFGGDGPMAPSSVKVELEGTTMAPAATGINLWFIIAIVAVVAVAAVGGGIFFFAFADDNDPAAAAPVVARATTGNSSSTQAPPPPPPPPPPVDCEGSWTSWDNCNAECGAGTQSRIYSISTTAADGGAACTVEEGTEESQACTSAPCPVPEPEPEPEPEPDGCAVEPCYSGVACTAVGSSSFTCGPCPVGYTGDGTTCTDIDACADSPCFAGVVCTDDAAPSTGYACGACPVGYSGDGITCTDTDECAASPCFANVACTDNTAPQTGFSCAACPAGYGGDGFTCTSQASPCDGDPCAANGDSTAVCTVDGTGFTCTCSAGYVGSQSFWDSAPTVPGWTGEGLCQSIADLMSAKESQLAALETALRNGYADAGRCNTCTCSQDACAPDTATWNADADSCMRDEHFGSAGLSEGSCPCGATSGTEMDLSASTVTVEERIDRSSGAVLDAVCSSKGMDARFLYHANSDRFMRGQWFGSESGVLREYPGNARSQFLFSGGIDNEVTLSATRVVDAGVEHVMEFRDLESITYTDADAERARVIPATTAGNAGVEDFMGCEDCIALGYNCAQCQRYGFDCAYTCTPTGATSARVEYENRQKCKWDEPVQENWYVSAVSGVKEVILVLDLSKSMAGCATDPTGTYRSQGEWYKTHGGNPATEAADGNTATCQTRLDVMQTAAKKVLRTLTSVDFAQIVIFGDRASCYHPGTTPTYDSDAGANAACTSRPWLVSATAANIASMIEWVDSITVDPTAGADWYDGFAKAFQIYSFSREMDNPDATKIVMFVTDGVYTASEYGHNAAGEQLVSAVREWNSESAGGHNAHILWYTMPRPASELIADHIGELTARPGWWMCGVPTRPCTAFHDMYMGNVRDVQPNNPLDAPWSGEYYAKRITCEHDGIWVHVREPINLDHYMSQYYEIFQRSNTGIHWGEPVPDPLLARGAHAADATFDVITISKAVYPTGANSDVLLGVVGLSIPMSYFGVSTAPNTEDRTKVIEAIGARRTFVETPRAACVVDKLRYEHGVITSQYAEDIAIEDSLATVYGALGNREATHHGWTHFSTCCRGFDSNAGTEQGGFRTTEVTAECGGSTCLDQATPRAEDPGFVCEGADAAHAANNVICLGTDESSQGDLSCCGGLTGGCPAPNPPWVGSSWQTTAGGDMGYEQGGR